MARMYPDLIDPETQSGAERRLYEAFRTQLGDDYVVFHAAAWQAKDREGRPRDGEVDFVICHPQRGILTLEAKGGAIRCDPRAGTWTSIDRHGEGHQIKDPFGQARDAKYALDDALRLRQRSGASRPPMNLGHAVAFPDVVFGEPLPGLDKPREIILDATDLAHLSAWVGGSLAYWRGKETQASTAPGDETVRAILDLLGKSRELRPALWGQLVQEEQELIHLTEQQYRILDTLSRQRQALICGCAASGKTMLAVEKATRLARQGFRVLLTCFNRNLAADLRERLGRPPNLHIHNFHELCYQWAHEAGLAPPAGADFFSEGLPDALLKASDTLQKRYDAIIVDEGQDFQEHWWIPLQKLLAAGEHGILYIFYDDNQRLYVKGGAFPIPGPPYPLSVNCRNTQHIHQVVTQFYQSTEPPKVQGPLGRPVELVPYDEPPGLWLALTSLLRRLQMEDRIPEHEIAVLTPLADRGALWPQAEARRGGLSNAWPPKAGSVYCGTIYSFKGLERPVVILAEMERWYEDLLALLYVGCSRARNHLIVLLPTDCGPELRDAFAVAGQAA